MSTSAPVSSSSSSSSSSSHKTTSATTTTTTTTTTSTMQYASNLCSQGRSAWQQQRYVEALEHFGTAVRLLESSLGGYHPLVAKTYYWIGFIYKHSLTNTTTTTTSSTTTTTSDNSTTSSTAAVDVQYLLLALAAFTKSARIRLSLPEKKRPSNNNINKTKQQQDQTETGVTTEPTANETSNEKTIPSKDVSINQDGGVVPNKAIQEAKQAIQWVIRAIQERYNNNNNMNNMNNNPSIQEETTNVTLSSTDPDTSFSNSSQKSIYLTTTTWQQYQTYQQLVLGTKLSHGHNEKNDATDNNNNNNDTTTDDGLYLTALEDSIRLEAKGDTLLRQYQYGTALELYQASMDSFPDPHHAALWGKCAFCHHQLHLQELKQQKQKQQQKQQQQQSMSSKSGNIQSSSTVVSSSSYHQQQAVHDYRQALKLFRASHSMTLQISTSTSISTSLSSSSTNDNNNHQTTLSPLPLSPKRSTPPSSSSSTSTSSVLQLDPHPDTDTTLQRLLQVITNNTNTNNKLSSIPTTTSSTTRNTRSSSSSLHGGDRLSKSMIQSVQFEQAADDWLWQYEWIGRSNNSGLRKEGGGGGGEWLLKAQQRYHQALNVLISTTAVIPSSSGSSSTSSSSSYSSMALSQSWKDLVVSTLQRSMEEINSLQEDLTTTNTTTPGGNNKKNKKKKDMKKRTRPNQRHGPSQQTTNDTLLLSSLEQEDDFTDDTTTAAAATATIVPEMALPEPVLPLEVLPVSSSTSSSSSFKQVTQPIASSALSRHSISRSSNKLQDTTDQGDHGVLPQNNDGVMELHAQIQELTDRLGTLELEKSKSQHTVSELSMAKEGLVLSLTTSKQQISKLARENKSLSKELLEVQTKSTEMALQLQKAESELSLVQSRLQINEQQQLEEKNRDDDDNIQQSDRRIKELEAALDVANKQVEESNKRIGSLEAIGSTASAQYEELKLVHEENLKRLEEATIRVKELEESSASRHMDRSLPEKLSQATMERDAAIQELSQLRDELEKVKEHHAVELVTKVQEAQQQRDAIKDDLAKLQQEHEKVISNTRREPSTTAAAAAASAAISIGSFAPVSSEMLQLETKHAAETRVFRDLAAQAETKLEQYREDVSKILVSLASEIASLLQRESSVPAEVSVVRLDGSDAGDVNADPPHLQPQGPSLSGGMMQQYHKETLAEIQSILQSLRDERRHADTKLTKLQRQNAQAAVLMQKISSQLKSKNVKYKTLRKQVMKILTLHTAMDTNVRTLRETIVKDGGRSKSAQATLDELHKHLQAVMELVAACTSSRISSQNSAGSLFSSDDTLETKDMMMPFVDLDHDSKFSSAGRGLGVGDKGGNRAVPEIVQESILCQSSQQINPVMESSLADYMVRPIVVETAALGNVWGKLYKSLGNDGLLTSPTEYIDKVRPTEPSTLEIIARIKYDGSLLYLRGTDRVMILAGGKWTDYGSVDRRDVPLGWVVNNKGQDYSLDQVLEEAMIYREQYCRMLARKVELMQLPEWERILLEMKAKMVDSKVAHAFWLLAVPLAIVFEILKLIRLTFTTDTNTLEVYSAAWWQSVKRCLEFPIDEITNIEGATYIPVLERGRGLDDIRMTVDFMDFMVEHLSHCYKWPGDDILAYATERIQFATELMVKKGLQQPPSSIMQTTLAVIPFATDTDNPIYQRTLQEAMAATIASLLQYGIGRVVIVGHFAQDSILQLAFVHTKGDGELVPKEALRGLKQALQGKIDENGLVPEMWLGPKLPTNQQSKSEGARYPWTSWNWEFIYFTEPDQILNARLTPSFLEAMKGGGIILPHRLQPIPMSSIFWGLTTEKTAPFQRQKPIFSMDSEVDACCDLGPNSTTGIIEAEKANCADFWWGCSYDDGANHFQDYDLIRATTGVVHFAADEHARKCRPVKGGRGTFVDVTKAG
ncbi:hypothetical protein IV203_021664 [Nitzschia inconspicua]|uniref:Uncharacterized protein n=2 Tax=Nitzschia inconspicua TaxID=303405 RepID=A0A9K3KHS5_9STRA|nr:hypothetical protein IV203_021664 [Nitzschia inconspicua]